MKKEKHQITSVFTKCAFLITVPLFSAWTVEGRTSEMQRSDATAKINVRSDSLKFGKSPWIMKNKDILYWAISPLATIAEIHNINLEIRNFGGEMNLDTISYDPLRLYITSLGISIKIKGAGGQSFEKEGRLSPVKGKSGYIARNGSLGMGAAPPAPLNQKMEADYQKALMLKKEKEAAFFEHDLYSKIRGENKAFTTTGYTKQSLEGQNGETSFNKTGIGRSPDQTLRISGMYKFVESYLNGKPTGLATLNTIPFDQFVKLDIVTDGRGKKYFLVYTK